MKTRLAGLLIGFLLVGVIWWGVQPDRFSGNSTPSGTGQGAVPAVKKPATSSQDSERGKTSSRDSRRPSSAVDPAKADEEISRLLGDDAISVLDASKGLLAIAADSRVEKAARADALQHGLNLVSDEDYADLVLPELEDNLFESPEMQRLLLDDAYNREDLAKLPAALAVMKHGQGEIKTDARELLAFLLNAESEDWGDNYDLWHKAVIRRMADIPQEE